MQYKDLCLSPEQLILCVYEGHAEKYIIEMLLDANLLKFSRESLIDDKPFHGQTLSYKMMNQLNNITKDASVTVVRIGDTLNAEFIKKNSPHKSKVSQIIDLNTQPEIEILIIINEGKYSDYSKKGKPDAVQYCKENIFKGKKKYEKTYSFWSGYWEDDVEKIVRCLKEYERVRHKNVHKYSIASAMK